MQNLKGEQEYVRKKLGKWATNEVPHTGWVCTNIQDLGEATDICEMCEAHSIRYVHYMNHKDYPISLAVGCVCAGYMEGNMDAAIKRDTAMQTKAQRRRQWLKRKWKVDSNGNEYTKTREFYIVTIYNLGTHWGGRIKHDFGTFNLRSKRKYNTSDEAKLAAFDALQIILARDEEARREEERKWHEEHGI